MPFPLLFHRLLSFGRRAEIDAIDHLRSLGYRIVNSPYRGRHGEIDVVAWEGNVLAFVEVKALHSAAAPEDAVGLIKQQRIVRTANEYLSKHRLHDVEYRFDILAITAMPGSKREFRLLRDAFRMYN